MKTIKYLVIATALAPILGLVVNVQAMHKEEERLDEADQLQAVDDALLIAVSSGNVNAALNAVGAGANVNAADQKGVAALLLASQEGHTEIVNMLLGARAEVDKADPGGVTPLFMASQNRHTHITTLLLEAQAEVDKARHDGVTPLFMASQDGHVEIVTLLLGANAEVDKANHEGVTPLFMASQDGHAEIVTLLLEAQAEVDHADHCGVIPLFMASQNGHTDIATLLIANNANPNRANKRRCTALNVATSNTLEAIAQARAVRPKPDAPVRCVAQPVSDLPVMLALAVAAESQGHQHMVSWLLKSDPQAQEHAGNCSICAESFVDLVGNKAELRRTNQACQHLVCDICEQLQLRAHVAPQDPRDSGGIANGVDALGNTVYVFPGRINLARCPVCRASRGPAFEPTEDQAQEFEKLQQLFLGAEQEEKKDGNDDEQHF